MFHAAKALLLNFGENPRTHRGTIYLMKNKERFGLSEDDCVKTKAFDLRRK